MEKQEYIDYWRKTAERDWEVVGSLFKSEHYTHSLFFVHLVIEKLLKAHWVKDNIENFPPKLHNLETIYDQTDLELDNDEIDLLRIISAWNIEARYNDFKSKFYNSCTKEYTEKKLKEIKGFKDCLLEKLL